MSDVNPYNYSTNVLDQPATYAGGPSQVKIEPIELCKRSIALMGEQFWLFVGLGLVAILVGSIVPFGILQGPMMVGYFLCFLARERNTLASFDTLFKGFDQFGNALIAFLLIALFCFVVFFPVFIVAIVGFAGLGAALGPDSSPGLAIGVLIIMVILMMGVTLLTYIPVLFAFPLIADRKMSGVDAVMLSFKGAMRNFGGLFTLMLVLGGIGILATLCCYIPVFLWFPVASGAIFLAYRDIFGSTTSPT